MPRTAPATLTGTRIAIPDEVYVDELSQPMADSLAAAARALEDAGATVTRVSLPTLSLGIAEEEKRSASNS